jgi:hypothetical protein
MEVKDRWSLTQRPPDDSSGHDDHALETIPVARHRENANPVPDLVPVVLGDQHDLVTGGGKRAAFPIKDPIIEDVVV